MKLLTKAIENKIPALYSQDGKDPKDVKIAVHFFGGSDYSAYATEYDPDTRTFFGYVTFHSSVPGNGELGYFSLDELQKIRFKPFGLPIERDRHYEGTLAEVMGK
jgi:hypothetical protein